MSEASLRAVKHGMQLMSLPLYMSCLFRPFAFRAGSHYTRLNRRGPFQSSAFPAATSHITAITQIITVETLHITAATLHITAIT